MSGGARQGMEQAGWRAEEGDAGGEGGVIE